MIPSDVLSRRAFVRQACCAAVGTTGMLSALGQLRVIGAVAGDGLPGRAASLPADYKALVCIFLNGGNDANNLIIPADATSYAAYARARSELSIRRTDLLPITSTKYSDGRSYALHPSVPGLQTLYSQGKVAVLANVGTLVRPTTLADYRAGRNLPPQLFSHNDQTMQWQSSIPDRPFETGWGGRLADLLDAMNSNNQVSMSITLSGTNSFQRGTKVAQFATSSAGPARLQTGGSIGFPADVAGVVRGIFNDTEPNTLAAAFGNIMLETITDGEALSAALANASPLATVFPGSSMASSLSMVAKLISVSQSLGLKRQVFYVSANGYDLHGGQTDGHGPLLAELSAAMKAFYDATVELGVANQVTTFTASDFGRTYIPNSGGTDHGWGNHQLIMGGAVQGGDIYGRMPSLTVNADDDVGRGRWIPSTSVDEYNATLATWFGVSATNLPVVLPNIGRFAKPNLGFMG
ncbi:MAG: DUF1501 domain-containing protein [Opitutaceae bacterium]|nr:DUF1501 domain-containing protein [Opitutaceae bacterium]